MSLSYNLYNQMAQQLQLAKAKGAGEYAGIYCTPAGHSASQGFQAVEDDDPCRVCFPRCGWCCGLDTVRKETACRIQGGEIEDIFE